MTPLYTKRMDHFIFHDTITIWPWILDDLDDMYYNILFGIFSFLLRDIVIYDKDLEDSENSGNITLSYTPEEIRLLFISFIDYYYVMFY